MRLTSGAKAWLLLLASRSDDAGKPVWGNQVKMGERIGRCDRSVRRYRAEAEALGYVVVYRSKPIRGPGGRWCRRKANSYYLRIPAAATASGGAPRRRQRASYCVITAHHPTAAPKPATSPPPSGGAAENRSTVLADSDGRSSPPEGASTGAAPPMNNFKPAAATSIPSPADREAVSGLIAGLKAKLRAAAR